MAWLFGTVQQNTLGAGAGSSGSLFQSAAVGGGPLPGPNQITFPPGVNTVSLNTVRPNAVNYKNRCYMWGGWTDNMVTDEFYRMSRNGIQPPSLVPTLAAGAGPGPTGNAIVAITFFDEKTQERSALSGQSSGVALANQSRVVGNIPTTSSDPRVSHVEVWVSMDGALFRLSVRRQLGVSSITENIATLALGAAFPTTFQRFPFCTFGAVYHDRIVMAGNAQHPDTLYVSGIGLPEHYEGLSFATRNGEPITGLIVSRDICLVGTPRAIYQLHGYLDTDMTLTLLEAEIGMTNHYGATLILGNAWFHNDRGVFMYNGNFHNMTRNRQQEWQARFAKYQSKFEGAFAIHDPNEYTYQLITSPFVLGDNKVFEIPENINGVVSIATIVWVANYAKSVPEINGTFDTPDWSFDAMNKQVASAALLAQPGGKRVDAVYGFCDGFARKRDSNNANDDGDLYDKQLWIRSPAYHFDDAGGDIQEGKYFHRVWSFMESETTQWTLYCKAGDEEAYQELLPDNVTYFWKNTVPGSFQTQTIMGITLTYAPKTVHVHMPERVSGRMLTLEYAAPHPISMSWRGFGGTYSAGVAHRGVVKSQGGA